MERRNAIKLCCYSALAIPVLGLGLQSCAGIYYGSFTQTANRLTISKSEFLYVRKDKTNQRDYILIDLQNSSFPICIYKQKTGVYHTSLLKCTHRNCELNVGGGIFSCPCHGSEFDVTGRVIEGPALEDLTTFKTEVDHENIYVYLA